MNKVLTKVHDIRLAIGSIKTLLKHFNDFGQFTLFCAYNIRVINQSTRNEFLKCEAKYK